MFGIKPRTVIGLFQHAAKAKNLIGKTKLVHVYDLGKVKGFEEFSDYALHVRFHDKVHHSPRGLLNFMREIHGKKNPLTLEAPHELVEGANIGQSLMQCTSKHWNATVSVQLKQEGETITQRLGKRKGRKERRSEMLKEIVEHAKATGENPFLEPVRQIRGLLDHRIMPDIAKGNITVKDGTLRLLDQTTNTNFGNPLTGISFRGIHTFFHKENLVNALTKGADTKDPAIKAAVKEIKLLAGHARQEVEASKNLFNTIFRRTDIEPIALRKTDSTLAIGLKQPPKALLSQLTALRDQALPH